jgi:hypothetical protein
MHSWRREQLPSQTIRRLSSLLQGTCRRTTPLLRPHCLMELATAALTSSHTQTTTNPQTRRRANTATLPRLHPRASS